MKFVNRKHEFAHLEKEYHAAGAKLIVIYGRRRVGKTRLIEEFIKKKKAIYYMAAQEKDALQIKEFKEIIAKELNDSFLADAYFESWKQLFAYLEKVWPAKQRIVLVIDEVTYIIKENSSFTSYLQKFWDAFLSKTDTKLILSGSLVGLMVKEVLSYNSPLYGRRTSEIHLESFCFSDSCGFMKHLCIEDQIKFYSVTGGVPKYLLFITKGEHFNEFLINNLFNKEGFFYREGLFLLSQEFKDPSTYINILKAMANGNTKLNEIANFTGLESKKISSYIDILILLNLVKKEIPITEDEKRFRGAFYSIDDNFLSFWHKFIYPNRSDIEIRKEAELMLSIGKEINSYIGIKFEQVCKEVLSMQDQFSEFIIGKWWGFRRQGNVREAVEIDIAGINNKTKEIIFGECKWKDNVDAEKILSQLKEKAKHVEWNNSKRKEKYAIFAKSFKKKIKQKDFFLFDLKDIADCL